MRFDEVSRTVGLRRSAIYNRIRAGKFPAPLNLGSRAVAWRADEIAAWIEAQSRSLEAA